MLKGLRVLDWTNESGFLAGRILGDLGADVIKIEPPGGDLLGRRGPRMGPDGDPEQSLSWLANNTSKRGIVLDLASETDQRQYRALVRTADVILETFSPGWLDGLGLGYAELSVDHPGLIHCAMTPFGPVGSVCRLSGTGSRVGRDGGEYGRYRGSGPTSGAQQCADCLLPCGSRGSVGRADGALPARGDGPRRLCGPVPA